MQRFTSLPFVHSGTAFARLLWHVSHLLRIGYEFCFTDKWWDGLSTSKQSAAECGCDMVDLLPFLKHLSNSALSHPHIRSCSSVAKTRLVETGREVVVLVKKAILVYGYPANTAWLTFVSFMSACLTLFWYTRCSWLAGQPMLARQSTAWRATHNDHLTAGRKSLTVIDCWPSRNGTLANALLLPLTCGRVQREIDRTISFSYHLCGGMYGVISRIQWADHSSKRI